MTSLSTKVAATDWAALSLSALVEYILGTHHAYLKSTLPRLESELGCAPAIAPVLRALHLELDAHLLKEEMILFPFIRTMEAGGRGPSHCGSVQNPIRVMMAEHDSAQDALSELRRLTDDYRAPAGSDDRLAHLYTQLQELERDLQEHIRLENEVLFPRAIALE